MKIRTKLALTLILLQVFGITAISSFSILFIRAYLLQDGIDTLKADTEWIVKDLQFESLADNYLSDTDEIIIKLNEVSGYDFRVYDVDGNFITATDDDLEHDDLAYQMKHLVIESESNRLVYNQADSAKLYSYIYLGNNPKELQFFELSKNKEDFYAIIATIRWIIYLGMFISIGIVTIVGFVLARSISEPILKLNESALNIADGNTYKAVDVKRNDEIGTLANSINKMASHLSEDNERLAALNLRQRQFFGDITHEVRNPLQALLTGFDILELDLPAEKKATTMEMSRAQVSRIRQLFDDLGILARLDEDPNFIQKEEIDLVPIIQNLVGIYQPLAKEKGLTLALNIPENAKVIADQRKIEQVLDNLISNAVKYTQKGKIDVSVTNLSDKLEVGQGVEVSISDTGTGIDVHHLSHLFERFYRTDKARSRNLGGTGLGLSIVKSILELHQSTINVESEVGKGSRFWFTI